MNQTLNKYYLPFYSSQALEVFKTFATWLQTEHYMFDFFSQNGVRDWFKAGFETNGQVTLLFRLHDGSTSFSPDTPFRLFTKALSHRIDVCHSSSICKKPFRKFFDEFLMEMGYPCLTSKMIEPDYSIATAESDVKALVNWMKTGKVEGFSEKFIGKPFDPFKIEKLQLLAQEWLKTMQRDELCKEFKEFTGRDVTDFFAISYDRKTRYVRHC